MTKHRINNEAICPECEGIVQLNGNLHIGQKITCRRCGSILLIVNRKPLDLVLSKRKSSFNVQGKAKKVNREIDWTDESSYGFVKYPKRSHAP